MNIQLCTTDCFTLVWSSILLAILSNSIHHCPSSILSLSFLTRSCNSTKASLSRWFRDMQSGTQVENEN